jgi:hypothetical protein
MRHSIESCRVIHDSTKESLLTSRSISRLVGDRVTNRNHDGSCYAPAY